MNVTLRYCLVLAAAFLFSLSGHFGFEDRPAQGQTITSYADFWEALDSGNSTITLGSLGIGPMKDEDDEPMDFLLDNPVENTITISGTATIKYNSKAYDPDSEDEFYQFRIDVVGGTLAIGSGTTTVTNGYSDTGVFYVEDGTLSFQNATFQSNYADDSGGAIYAITGFDATSVNVAGKLTLTSNTAESGDGGGLALYNDGTSLNVSGATEMTSNKAGGGGAIYGQGAAMTFDGTLTASQNRVSGDGGVFNLDTGAVLTVSGTATFTQNAAEYDFTSDDDNSAIGGGAIYANMSTATFKSKAVFGAESGAKSSGNTAKNAGGAIYAEGDSIFTFQQSAVFGGNTVSAGSGGAIYLDSSQMTFSGGAAFTGNEAKLGEGGAMVVSTGTLNFSGTVDFKDNVATGGDYGGGAIYADMESVITFATGSTVTFSGNKALVGEEEYLPGGGAAYLSGIGGSSGESVEYGWTMLGNATFSSNVAAGSGGAIYVETSALQFDTVIFSGNQAGFKNDEDSDQRGGGGALLVDSDSVVHFEQKATFQDNTASAGSGGAVFMTMSGAVDVESPIPGMHFKNGAELTGNKAVDGGAFFLEDSVVTFGGATTISGNEASGRGGAFYVQGDTLLHFEAGGTTSISGNKASGSGGAVFVNEDSNLTLKIGGTTGTAAASVTVAAGTSNAANDIFLAAGATLHAVLDTGSTLTINSALSGASRDDGDTFLNVTGPGTVQLGGDTTGFHGDILIDEGGTLIVNPGSKVLGDIDNTTLTISGGTLTVMLDQDGSQSDPARIQVAALDIDSEGKGFQFDVSGFITNESEIDEGFALLSINDSSGKEILEQYLSEERITWLGSTDFQSSILSDGDIWTLYVYVVFDPDTQEWNFNVGNETTRSLDIKLDNTDPEHPSNQYKGLTVTGTGTLELLADENHVSYLSGTGHVKFDGTLYVNGQISGTTDVDPFEGSLLGTGTFVKEGDYTQELLGSNTEFTGDFDVREGTLLGNTESIRTAVNVAEDAELVIKQDTLDGIDQDPQRTFEGTLTGNGTVQFLGKVGIEDPLTSGTTDTITVIDKDNSAFEGDIFIDRGWLLVNGKASTGQPTTESTGGDLSGAREIRVGADGGLGGSGTVGNTVITNGGALQAYQGSLLIDGDLEIQTGGIVYFELGGVDVIDVTGTVSLEKGIWLEIATIADDYIEGDTLVFPISGGLIELVDLQEGETLLDYIGSHEYTVDGETWELEFELDEEGNLLVSGTIIGDDPPDPPEPVIVTGLSRNQTVVATALATIRPLDTTPTEMKNFIDKLDTYKTTDSDGNTLYDKKYLDATKQLAGTVRAEGLQLGLFSPSQTVLNRLSLGSSLYGGSPTIYNNGYGPISGLESRGAGAAEMTYRGQQGMLNSHYDGGVPTCDIPCMMGENNFWVDVTHVQTKTKGNDNSYEYGSSRTGLLIGMDVQKKVDSRIGAVFGYFAPYLWQNSDRVEADDYHAGLYFQKNHLGTDLYGYFGYAHQEYRSRRFVNMGLIDPDNFGLDRYNGSTRGDSFNFSLEMSKPRYYGDCYVLRPLIGLDYFYTKQKGYTESGDGLFGLRYNKAEYDQLFVRVGLNLKKETFRSTTVLRIQYINQFGEEAYPDANAQFTYSGAPTMNVRGVNLGRDYLNLGFGYNLFINDARSKFVSLDYDFNTSRKTKSHGISLILVERF